MPRPVLHHAPPSFYSQVARLALVEKGVGFDEVLVAAGPPFFDNYAPEYLRLNPNAVIPTLQHGDEVVYDATRIARYADARFDGPRLTPEDPAVKAEMDRWVDRLDELPIRILTYSTLKGPLGRLGARINDQRIAALRRLRAAHPGLADIYDAKIEDIEGFIRDTRSPEAALEVRARASRFLDELDARLEGRTWLTGEAYSLADAVWTTVVARMQMNKLAPLEARPRVAAWYARARARPSFEAAEVWERFRPAAMIRMVGSRLSQWAADARPPAR